MSSRCTFIEGHVRAREYREDIWQNLEAILSGLTKPLGFPAIFVDCTDCGCFHVLPWDGPACGKT
jgi:hypothetical protein